MPMMVTTALREHRRRQLEDRMADGARCQDHDYVFATTHGAPLDPSNVVRSFRASLAAGGLPRQRLHHMRHACATLLIEQGEELSVVSRLFGHANLSTTADVYAHLTRGMQRRAADRMDAIVGAGGGL